MIETSSSDEEHASVNIDGSGDRSALLALQQASLASEARERDALLPQSEVEAAVDSGICAAGHALKGNATLDDTAVRGKARATTQAVVRAGAEIRAAESDEGGLLPPGVVIPVVPASSGAGASVVAAVLADALQAWSWRVLVADTADPVRSGLAWSASSEGPVSGRLQGLVRLRFSWRGQALLARVATKLPVLSPGLVPPPGVWVPPMRQAQVTVADLSYDAWRLAAQPLSGPGAWLRQASPAPNPVLVVRPSRPSLQQAEQFLARLESWSGQQVAVSPSAVVVVGASRWPRGVVGAAGARISRLLEKAVFLPYETSIAMGGIGPEITPMRLRRAVLPLLAEWNLIPETAAKPNPWWCRWGGDR